MQNKFKEEYNMDNCVIREEENYSDFIKEIMVEEQQFNNKGKEVFCEEDRGNRNITIEDYSFLAK